MGIWNWDSAPGSQYGLIAVTSELEVTRDDSGYLPYHVDPDLLYCLVGFLPSLVGQATPGTWL